MPAPSFRRRGAGPHGDFSAIKKDLLLNVESLRQVLSHEGKCLS